MTKEQAIEQLKDLKAVYSGAVQAGEISIANMIKGGIDLIEKLQKEIESWKSYSEELEEKTTEISNKKCELEFEVERLQKENEELKEYIAIAPNLDEMTATKYRNIQQDAYIQGRAEEQQKAEQIIYENYIPIQKVKDKIEELKEDKESYYYDVFLEERDIEKTIEILQKLLKESEEE